MTPFPVAGKALPVIGAFQARLTKVVRVGLAAVTILARLYLIGGTIVMTGAAFPPHLGHSGMQLMIEMNRLIEVGQVIQKHRIGRLGKLMVVGCMRQRKAGTGLQTFIFHGWIVTRMTGFAIHLRHFPYRGNIGRGKLE